MDEAVLALTEYKTPDPLVEFYTPRAPGVRESSLRERVVLARPDVTRMKLQEKKSAERGGRYPSGAMPPPMASPTATSATVSRGRVIAISEVAIMGKEPEIAVRTNFTPLAAFVPRVAIDAAGRASVPVKLPDNLTRYRVMAIAAAGENRFGSGESTVTARLPLMVRPSLPRFLNFGDKFEMPIVLQNQTDRAMDVDVAVRAKNATTDTGGRRVTVPANDRVEVRIAAAAARPGTAHFQIGAVSGKWSDASQIDLPVWTPATTEAFATYGTIDEGAVAQPVRMPTAIIPTVGGIEITTSSTALQALTDAVIYLVRYPYECNEQISSRMLGLAALKDVLTAFDAKGLPKPEVMLESVKRDVEKLRSRQNYTGGWDYWQSERTSPYVTIHVTHALQRVKEKGFEVNAEVLANALTYLRAIETHIPSYYGPEARRAVVAYALYVRKRMGDLDRARARRLVEEGGGAEKVGLETLGWILPVLSGDAASATEVSAIRKHLANRVSETAGAAHFVSSYGEDDDHLLLRSDRRADGVLLEALIGDQPTSDLIPKLVTGLLAHRKAGHWENTQENAFVLLGLDRYFAAYEKATPDFVARAWLGPQFAGEHTFKGRTTERSRIDIPMRYLADAKPGASVVVGKDGPGRLYYRIGMQYAPADLRPPPMDQGFTVSRVYDGVDAPSDVQRDPDGTWRVKAGAKVRVRITMVAPSRRYQVALVDQLPAGLEPMNAALAVTGSVPEDPKAAKSLGYGWWWSRSWYEHQNMRDERVEAFTSLLWEGVYDYTYVARATTPGTFVVPPPKAEEMYSPETFGRGAGDRLIVE